MKILIFATLPAMAGYSRRLADYWLARQHFNRPFPTDNPIGRLVRLADTLPAVVCGFSFTTGVNR